MNGAAVSVHDVYDLAFGLDLGAGVDRWFVLSPRLELGVGPRLHGLYTALQGRPAYRTFQSATCGVGIAGELAYAIHRTLFGAPVVVGAFLQSNIDLIDALHGDRLDYGLSLLGGASAGVRW